MEDVFRALGDPSRRLLLDALRDRDGQTLVELTARLDMSRQAVMKHLVILEDAALLTTVKRGREKFHYLNAVPIREIHDRWISRFTEPAAAGLVALKRHLEKPTPTTTTHVTQVHIRATPQKIWDALTIVEQYKQWGHGLTPVSTWTVGSPIQYVMPDGSVATDGEIIEIDEPHGWLLRVRHPFHELAEDPPYLQRLTVEDLGDDVCRVTIEQSEVVEGSATEGLLTGGTRHSLDSFKSFVETGRALGA